jgi:hypothetical protein
MSCRPLVMLLGLLIVAAAQRVAVAQSTPSSTASNPVATAPIPEVTIQAQRAELDARIGKFVDEITVAENGGEGGLAYWVVPPVCPLVAGGLPGPEREFLLSRLRKIGRQAGVPQVGADERCKPNLYIWVTRQPEELLHDMGKHYRARVFGYETWEEPNAPPTLTLKYWRTVEEFIATPRVVRVWYNLTLLRSAGFESRIRMSKVRSFLSVFVVVDQGRLQQGITRGQFADYVAMVSLAKLKPELHLGDTPTILKLFDGAPTAAPAGLTAWDQAFLASLYTTDQGSRLQRSQIAHSMVRILAP